MTRPTRTAAHRRLAGWCIAAASAGTPGVVLVLLFGHGDDLTAGAGVIGTMSVAGFATARSLLGAESAAPRRLPRRRRT